MRLIWMLIFAASFVAVLRLCAWADTGMKGDKPVEQSLIPN